MPHHGAIAHKKPPRIRKAAGALLVLAAALLQSPSPAWAVDRLSTGQSWYVLNETGIDLLGVQRLRITGPDADAFTIEGYTGSPTGMTPSQDVFTPALKQKTPSTPLGVNLRFTPQHSGSHQASLEVTHDGTNVSPLTYPLTGNGDWDLGVQPSTSTINFGARAMGSAAVTLDAFARAVGSYGWLHVTGAKLEGSLDFTLAQVGLATKGTTSWGTGANVKVLPTGTTESSQVFTGSDVTVGGLTDAAVRVRYTPTLRGPQSGSLTVYHDGPGGESTFSVVADGLRTTSVQLQASSPYNPYGTVQPVTDFSRVAINSTALTKIVYLKASGTSGAVTYKGFRVDGALDINIATVGQIYNNASFYPNCKASSATFDVPTYYGAISYGASGSRGDSFSKVGTSVAGTSASGAMCGTKPGKDFGVTLRYTPHTLGKQTATVTLYHDGNDQGFTTFDISGEAY